MYLVVGIRHQTLMGEYPGIPNCEQDVRWASGLAPAVP